MLDRVIDSWRALKFSRILAVEHARSHDLPSGAQRKAFDDSVVTIYRLESTLAGGTDSPGR